MNEDGGFVQDTAIGSGHTSELCLCVQLILAGVGDHSCAYPDIPPCLGPTFVPPQHYFPVDISSDPRQRSPIQGRSV